MAKENKMEKGSIKVRIRCVVDLPVGIWNRSCSMEDLKEQAIREGKEKLTRIMKEQGGTLYSEPTAIYVMVIDSDKE